MNQLNDAWLKQLPIDNIETIQEVSGGDVNDAYRLETPSDIYFLLVQPNSNESFYTAEIAGLREMDKAGVTAPRIIDSGEIDNDAFLLLSFLEEGDGSHVDLGKEIAKLHQFTSDNGLYGFDVDYAGKDSTFKNAWTDSWVELFVDNRLDVLRQQLDKKDFWRDSDNEHYAKAREIIVDKLEDRNPKPSLLHGDLWSGNFMFLDDGRPALFDPSPMYGDREFDIGVSTVFGGFNDDFYQSYNGEFPLDEGYEKRLAFYRLYLLMVHAVKFGSAYYSGTQMMLDSIINHA